MRPLAALFLTLVLAIAPALPSRAQAGETVVLCAGMSVMTVTLPADDGTGTTRLIGQLCADCVTTTADMPPVQAKAPAPSGRVSRIGPPLIHHALPQPAPLAPLARGPPARKM